MSEIKFACPHCRQHIACNGDYAELSIECPSCGGTMVVPRLTAASSEHPDMVVVASTSLPKPRNSQPIPTLDFWSESKWAEHSREATDKKPGMATFGFASLFATLTIALILVTRGFSAGPVAGSLLLGIILAGILGAKCKGASGTEAIVSGLLYAFAAMVLLPVLALGILFVGCAVCAQ